jgi:hypothetical protein
MYNMHNLICLSFRFESHIPENVVDQMNDILVQYENLLHDSSFDRVAEINNAMGQAHANERRKRYYLQIDFGIKQFVKGLFAGGMPYRHLKVLDQERHHHLIQDQEQEIPATERNEK